MSDAWARLGSLSRPPAENKPLHLRQAEWLQKCLASAQDTEFGRRHGFQHIDTPQAYQDAVPLHTYNDLRPWLERVAKGVPDLLFDGLPVAFECTAGSLGGAKLIPYSREGLKDFKNALRPWLAQTITQHGIQEGSCYWVTSPALRRPGEILPGIPLGLPDAAYLGEDLHLELGRISALPPWIGDTEDEQIWRLATLHTLVVRSDLVFISLWSPTFLLVLLDELESENPALDHLLFEGGILDGHVFAPNTEAMERLRIFRMGGRAEVLWPGLRLVSAWADGASESFARELQNRLPHAAFEPKGLLCTEGVVSVPVAGGSPVLAGDAAFFEFLLEDGEARFAWEVEEGETYEVILTTASGLYRYRTGDLIRCTGFQEDVPRLHFIGRVGIVSDLVGEKLHEAFVAQCLEGTLGFSMLIPSVHEQLRYLLVVDERTPEEDEALSMRIETQLSRNPQYAHAHRLRQLHDLKVLRVHAPLAKYTAHQVNQGQRPGNLKVPALRPELDWEMIFLQEYP